MTVHSPGPIIWTLKDLTIYLRAYHFFVTLGVRKNSPKTRSCDGVYLPRYFTFLHLVNYLTINQQVGHEARENHNGQWQVLSESGQAF